jgi:hypothetical protein
VSIVYGRSEYTGLLGKMPLRKPKHRWKKYQNIFSIKQIDGSGSGPADLLNTVMNIPVVYDAGNFFSS